MESYLQLLQDIKAYGDRHDDRTGVGTTSIFGYQWRHSMDDGFPLLTTKKVPLRWVAEELRWFLSGSTNEKDLAARGVDLWAEWATKEQCAKFGREEGELGPVYGALWRRFPIGNCEEDTAPLHMFDSSDQIKNLIYGIEQSPNSRRLIVSGWHPHYQHRVELPPCHTMWQVKCHNEKELSLHLYARSIDAFLGLPFNIASYALLLKLIATVTSMKARDLIISFGDLHIYNNHKEQCNVQIDREPRVLPEVYIDARLNGGGLNSLLSWTWNDIKLEGYKPHPKIDAEVAV